MKDQLISLEDIKKVHPIFRKSYGDSLARFVVKLAGLNNVNRVYDSAKYETGTDIEDKMIDGLGIKRYVHNIRILDQFEGKPFITVSNHPYGHLDGIMLVGEVAKVRPDFKVMVNWMLGMIDIMQDHFIGVNPYSSGSLSERSSLAGIKECIDHIKGNHPLGFFPAGAISKNKITRIEDREWQPSVLKLIQRVKVPVVPVFISGHNSAFFNFLDLIDWRLRTVRLCHELMNKKGKSIHMVFGKPITVEEQSNYSDIKLFGRFLKEKTYELKGKY
jgi:Putative hemolysin